MRRLEHCYEVKGYFLHYALSLEFFQIHCCTYSVNVLTYRDFVYE